MNENENELIKVNIKEITEKDKESFDKNGFLVIDNILPNQSDIDKLLKHAEQCFHGVYDKSITPDDVTWRPNFSPNDLTRELVNCWKSDSVLAQLVLNDSIGKLACELLGCDSVRVGQDNIFWKPTNGKPIGMHQDLPYLECITKKVITIWIALTDVSKENGTVEFVEGSHKWNDLPPDVNDSNSNEEFHNPKNYLKGLESALKFNDLESVEKIPIHYVTVKAGGCSIHHGKLWHGSNTNPSSFKGRMVVTIHFIPGDSEFNPNLKPHFSFGRYKIFGSNRLEESFYPITYSKNGYKSPIIPSLMKK
ncbi:hypothetical protein RB653_003493 [Dictyostelium firmibasis]|uniref:Phytanoyl-CoA dioxygenase n=1 Tax=Dictyostelium firmibasis TaxID=79012 RepID=A0AAN7UHI9_9MYCE